jgi:hypothetical protein
VTLRWEGGGSASTSSGAAAAPAYARMPSDPLHFRLRHFRVYRPKHRVTKGLDTRNMYSALNLGTVSPLTITWLEFTGSWRRLAATGSEQLHLEMGVRLGRGRPDRLAAVPGTAAPPQLPAVNWQHSMDGALEAAQQSRQALLGAAGIKQEQGQQDGLGAGQGAAELCHQGPAGAGLTAAGAAQPPGNKSRFLLNRRPVIKAGECVAVGYNFLVSLGFGGGPVALRALAQSGGVRVALQVEVDGVLPPGAVHTTLTWWVGLGVCVVVACSRDSASLLADRHSCGARAHCVPVWPVH